MIIGYWARADYRRSPSPLTNIPGKGVDPLDHETAKTFGRASEHDRAAREEHFPCQRPWNHLTRNADADDALIVSESWRHTLSGDASNDETSLDDRSDQRVSHKSQPGSRHCVHLSNLFVLPTIAKISPPVRGYMTCRIAIIKTVTEYPEVVMRRLQRGHHCGARP